MRRTLPIIMLLIAVLLTSCSSYFATVLSGTVVGNDNEQLNKAEVALYFDKAMRDADVSEYLTTKAFTHADYEVSTDNAGAYKFTNIMWNSNFPEYGKDGDSTMVYLAFYHDDYGVDTAESKINNKPSNKDLKFDNVNSKKINVRFYVGQGEVNTPSAVKSFKYSYTGHPAQEEYMKVVTNPAEPISIRYTGDSTTLTISNIVSTSIDSGELYYPVAKNESGVYEKTTEYTFTIDDDTAEIAIRLYPERFVLEGIRGYVEESVGAGDKISFNDVLELYTADNASTGKKSYFINRTIDDSNYIYSYEGLGRGLVIERDPDKVEPVIEKSMKIKLKDVYYDLIISSANNGNEQFNFAVR